MKIIFLGNSLVAGQYGGDFVGRAAELMPEHSVLNFGRGGSTIVNLLERLDEALGEEPDGVFVLAGGNDAISYSQPATRWYYEHAQGVPGGVVTPEQFTRGFRELLTRIQLAHALGWVALGPMEYNRETAKAVKLYNGLAREEARQLNLPVLDLMEALNPAVIGERPALTQVDINLIGKRIASGWAEYEAAREAGGFTYSFDGIHFTPETARRVGAMVRDVLSQEKP